MATSSKSRKQGRRRKSRTWLSGQKFPDSVTEDGNLDLPEDHPSQLHIACLYGDLAAVQQLVESKPSWVSSSDSEGQQPLHMVMASPSPAKTLTCLRYLLDHGANVNSTTDSGQTPLHLAASRGLLDCSDLLVKCGADVLARDNMGLTAFDLARIWCQRKVGRYLKSCMWQTNKTKEMLERKDTQTLYRDLLSMSKQDHINKKALHDEKIKDWAKNKGVQPPKDFPSRVPVSKAHKCLLTDQTSSKPKHAKSKSPERGMITQAEQAEARSTSPWSIFIGLQPRKLSVEPDLRKVVTLYQDSRSHKLQYIAKWDDTPHPTPDLPRDMVERVVFPRAFPSRINTSHFEPQCINMVDHRGLPEGKSSCPWTEVAIHLVENP